MARVKSPTRQRIVDAARDIIHSGNANPSMSEIADKARVSKSALYYFYKNKRDILLATMMEKIKAFEAGITAINEEKISPKEKLAKIMSGKSQSLKPEDAISQLLLRQLFSHDREVLRQVIESRRRGVAIITKIIEEGVKKGEFGKLDPKTGAELIAGVLDFICIAVSLPQPKGVPASELNPQAMCDQLYSLFLKT